MLETFNFIKKCEYCIVLLNSVLFFNLVCFDHLREVIKQINVCHGKICCFVNSAKKIFVKKKSMSVFLQDVAHSTHFIYGFMASDRIW